jgi:hypothetical protein
MAHANHRLKTGRLAGLFGGFFGIEGGLLARAKQRSTKFGEFYLHAEN